MKTSGLPPPQVGDFLFRNLLARNTEYIHRYSMKQEDTICAIATAPGGAIGIIRISGPESINIADNIFTPTGSNPLPLKARKANTVTFGTICADDGTMLDEVLVSLFRAPHSYTGEDSVEFSCHGSSYILQQTVQLLIAHGCRAAGPGEYTQRAFLNGKMDLSRAEAVADLIASTDRATHRMAMNQMRGGFSAKLKELRDHLLRLTSLMELELDFSDHEELEFADRTELREIAQKARTTMARLADSFGTGNALKNGVPVAIVGETNAGKSTLLNALLNEDKAIVSDIHGTTRDTIEDTTIISGVTFRFIDTAGIRRTDDKIEALGIERSFRATDQASIVILLQDSQRDEASFASFYDEVAPHLAGKHVILAVNKCDDGTDIPSIPLPHFIDASQAADWHTIAISAKLRRNIDSLRSLLVGLTSLDNLSATDIIVTNIRHYEALNRALEALNRVIDGLDTTIPADLIAQDLRECLYHLNDILGEVTTDEVLKTIFEHFCIGK